jgi:DEAD/DEAH box helicase domain-containing protein
LGEAVAEVGHGLGFLLAGAAPIPEVGYEGADERGRVFAEAELAWPDHKLVVLTPAQEDQAVAWKAKGWSVFMSSSQGWEGAVLAVLKQETQG